MIKVSDIIESLGIKYYLRQQFLELGILLTLSGLVFAWESKVVDKIKVLSYQVAESVTNT